MELKINTLASFTNIIFFFSHLFVEFAHWTRLCYARFSVANAILVKLILKKLGGFSTSAIIRMDYKISFSQSRFHLINNFKECRICDTLCIRA